MAHLDRFIEALHKHAGERLVVASGERVTLVVGDRTVTITNKPTNAAQVQFLLQEITEGDAESSGNGSAPREFNYSSPVGPMIVRVSGSDDGMSLEVAPESGSGDPSDVAPGPGDREGTDGPTDAAASDGSEPAAAPASVEDPAARSAMEALLRRTVEIGASDLHISADNPPMCRKDGSMLVLEDEPTFTAERTRQLLLSIAPEKSRDEFDRRHDSDFAFEIEDLARFRGNLFMDRKGAGGVFRVIPSEILTSEQLGLSDHILDLCRLTKGLVLVTGPTGSGKSTTLAAMMDYINRSREDHIITIEDPIEFVHPNKKCLINQREVGVHTDGFKVALRAALREDPDIVLVGELRDLETMEIAIETAETGHLVFGTLHTTTAPATVDRIIDQFPAGQQNQIRMMLADTLRGVIAQTLCKKKGGGRVAAMEILLVTPAIGNLIREGKTYQVPSAMQTGRNSGMQTLNSALVSLVSEGLVEAREAYLKAGDKNEFKSALERAGIQFDPASVGTPEASQ